MTRFSASDDALVSRRGFHREVARAAGGLAVGSLGFAQRGRAGGGQEKFPPGKYVDIHTHLGQPWSSRGPLTPQMMLQWMDDHQVAQAVILPLISPEAWYYPMTTDWVLQQTKPHRDRLIPFCDVDPRTDYLRGYKGFLEILKRYVDAGAVGLGEHKCGVAIDDPRNIDVFRACAEVSLPVLFHMDGSRNTDKPGLPGLEKVLREVPGANFLGHAPGFWKAIADGTLDRLMDKYPNLYGDLSAGSGANAIRRDLEFGREFVIRRADRLLFGTDYLAKGQGVPQFELYEKLDLPEDVQAKVFRDNARRVLAL